MTTDTTTDVFWIVKLPASWKEVFEEKAKVEGDTTKGAGARMVRKSLLPLTQEAD